MRWYGVWVCAILFSVSGAIVYVPGRYLPATLCALVVASLLLGTLYLARMDCAKDPLDIDSRITPAAVDPWAMQKHLMQISDQFLPEHPMMTKHSLTYLALTAEEVAETYAAMLKPLDRLLSLINEGGASFSPEEVIAIKTIRGRLRILAFTMTNESVGLRAELAKLREFMYELKMEEAVEILDGTTDTAVVNCGFTLASGLPGSEGYEEVGGSNLSKANPSTGRIDKTPDGKWIKGSHYRAPDLAAVLQGLRGAKLSTEQHASM
jgi:hypothetical protein